MNDPPNKSFRSLRSFQLLLLLCAQGCMTLQGALYAHDPSRITKDGDRFYVFATGLGIYSAYSTDLIFWTQAPTVFPTGRWPSWINTAVPGFAGQFWAPDVIYYSNLYYLFYACSTFGSIKSAIGVASSPSLAGPWTDHGTVVSSSDINAIDPSILLDLDGRIYLSYGSFFGGIGVIELDNRTMKPASKATVSYVVGGGTVNDYEASYLYRQGSYYYIFVNRAHCCRGSNSDYYIQVGRSLKPLGPYTGWTTVLYTSGKYIGPGHVGILSQDGVDYVSIHYYDGDDSGNPKLDLLTLQFVDNWPVLSRDWLPHGKYRITNEQTGFVWDDWGCTGALGQFVVQGSWASRVCQMWFLPPQGDGTYRITNAFSGLSANVPNCNETTGNPINIWDGLNNDCQKFTIERASNGNYVFTSVLSSQVVAPPGTSLTVGTRLVLSNYNGAQYQLWKITTIT